jgi:hypothetical protein
MRKIKHLTLLSTGWISLALGVIGIFLPLLPTTPFLLLSAWCFSQSSPRFHDWLLNHPKLGVFITAWTNKEGIDSSVKARIIVFMWLGMAISMMIIGKAWSFLLLACIGIMVTIHILRLPTKLTL